MAATAYANEKSGEKISCENPESLIQSHSQEELQTHKWVVLYETPDACATGNWQTYDIYSQQSVAIRFDVPKEDQKYTLQKVELWMMNNSVLGHAQVFVSIRSHDEKTNAPSDKILESWVLTLSPDRKVPELEEMLSTTHPILKKGKLYWVVAEALTPDDEFHVGWNKVAPVFDGPEFSEEEYHVALKTSGKDWETLSGTEVSPASVVVKGSITK